MQATPADRRAAARALAERNADRREQLACANDATLAQMALDRRDRDRNVAIDILARRVLARSAGRS